MRVGCAVGGREGKGDGTLEGCVEIDGTNVGTGVGTPVGRREIEGTAVGAGDVVGGEDGGFEGWLLG